MQSLVPISTVAWRRLILDIGQSETRIFCGSHVWPSSFREEDCNVKSLEDGRQVMSKAHITLWVRRFKNPKYMLNNSSLPLLKF